ncbi:MAG TPA: pyrimidine dimer DNA glycosylase/endonuclease V [bacterium]|nr:pyrimidine dimer DNA glycosylase/endonuclease V [bacterium]
MRLWSLHPRYLDTKGLLAVWREGLLAQKVLEGKTKGYKNHPQLARFKTQKDPRKAIGNYLLEVWKEAETRGYSFARHKVRRAGKMNLIPVTRGQIKYEWEHLRKKLRKRDPVRLQSMTRIPRLHPSFRSVVGPVEDWEKR